MKKIKNTFLALIAILLSPMVANADLIRVSQERSAGAGDFDSNVLGYLDAFDSMLTAAQYYGYDTSIAFSFNDGAEDVTLTSNMSHFFFVNAADGHSAFVVHDKPNDGAGGFANMELFLEGDSDWALSGSQSGGTF